MKSFLQSPLLLLSVAVLAAVRGLPVRYDQRQDGDWNVDARLQNFFVVLAPSNSAQLSSSGISLLDFASKAVPLRLRPPSSQAAAAQAGDDPEGQSRIPQVLPPKQREGVDDNSLAPQEVKEAVGRSADGFLLPRSTFSANDVPPVFTKDDIIKSPLAKLHPEMQVPVVPAEEILIARSPVVALKFPAVPMLVAIPVPEVAPEAPAPPALLPLQPVQTLDEAAAPSSMSEQPEQPVPLSPSEPTQDQSAKPAAEAAVETNQVETDSTKKNDLTEAEPDQSQLIQNPPRLHLVGTGIEDCGPARHRNREGICIDTAERD